MENFTEPELLAAFQDWQLWTDKLLALVPNNSSSDGMVWDVCDMIKEGEYPGKVIARANTIKEALEKSFQASGFRPVRDNGKVILELHAGNHSG